MKTGGRPRKIGPRYPCGDLVREEIGQPPPPAVIKRARDALVLRAADARHGSQVGRLGLMRAITPTQEAAAYHVAAIWGAHDRLIGRRRTVASPSYEVGRTGSSDVADERLSFDQRDRALARDRSTRRIFEAMLDQIPKAHGCRRVIEELCVEDQALPPGWIGRVRCILDQLSQHFRFAGTKQHHSARLAAAVETAAVEAAAQTIKAIPPKTNVERESIKALIHALRPDLDEAGITNAVRMHFALRDRERLRLQEDRERADLRNYRKPVNR